MASLLEWQRHDNGLAFTCHNNGHPMPVEDWARYARLPDGRAANLGPLLLLLEEEKATTADNDTQVSVPDGILADMEEWQAQGLGLPPHAPVRLTMASHGTLANPDFRLRYGFSYHDGVPATGASVTGCLFNHAGRIHLLPNPLYDIVARLDAYAATPVLDMDARFLWWSELAQLLPNESLPNGFLRQMHAVSPSAFSLDFRDEGGRLRVLPRFVRTRPLTEAGALHEDVLPAAVSADFQSRFSRQMQPSGRYALPGNWFVVLPPILRAAIEVVHRINGASEHEKRNFLHNPRTAIRAHIEAAFTNIDESAVESVFQETPLFLSERIKHLGVWVPKGGFYIKTEGTDWFPSDTPPQNVLLPIGPRGGLIDVRPPDILELQGHLDAARENGCPTLTFNGACVAVGDTTDRILTNALKMFTVREPDTGPESPPADTATQATDKDVPIIFDHIDETGHRADQSELRPVVATTPQLKPGVQLHEHQRQGLAWLQAHWTHASPGALLADDMGLGKTLQALAFLSWVRAQQHEHITPQRPFLIVAPTGLLRNWEEEADKFLAAPGLTPIAKAHGTPLRDIMEQGTIAAAKHFGNCGLVLTTYETLRDKISVFIAVHWGIVVFDEAQKIKNPKAMVTDMAKSLKAEFTLGLTGTPVENSLADLWCILDAMHPMRLETFRQFAATYMPEGSPTTDSLEALKEELAKPRNHPSLLRRLKETHWKERPAKRENLFSVTMPEEQAAAYSQALAKAAGGVGRPGAALEALQHIRSISLHPYVATWGTMPPEAYIAASARLKGTLDLLSNIRKNGEKALIFIEYRQMQMVLTEIIQQYFDCTRVLVINGAVTGPQRQERVHAFQNHKGFDVILLSPKAAGVGLNLTAATHVIHLSRWWNPAVEDQCTDRAYRIGQQHAVTIHYPLAVHPVHGDNSFDFKLHQLLERKRTLSRNLLGNPSSSVLELEELLTAIMDKGAPTPSATGARLLSGLDDMEPLFFEDWVADRLANMEYSVQKTPTSGDGGADIIATANIPGTHPSLLVQCKHTQTPQKHIDHSGVTEIIAARDRYALVGPVCLLLVTNSTGLTANAQALANTSGVHILSRHEMLALARHERTLLPPLPQKA